MKLYVFDGIDERLELVPLAARRALDQAGLKLSLPAWQSLPIAARTAIVEAGSGARVDVGAVREQAASARPAPDEIVPVADPDANQVPRDVAAAYGAERPLNGALWGSLSALDRYVLAKVAGRGKPERVTQAYAEVVGASAISTHLGPGGGVRMVPVSEKAATTRVAIAESRVTLNQDALARLTAASAPKGDVLGTARLAGIMAAKRTAELIPLCHTLQLTHVSVELRTDPEQGAVLVEARAETVDRTGVEMEALVAASVAALTVYDMLKAFDRSMEIGPTRLLAKSGGRSGDFRR